MIKTIKRLVLAGLLLMAIPIGASQTASGAACKEWNAANPDSHHKIGKNVDVVGGKGYGSGYHSSAYYSATGAYGDPKRRAGEGGYVQVTGGNVVATVYLFGPLDETDNSHLYDTVAGACVSVGNRSVNTRPRCVPTSTLKKPAISGWTPCGGY